MALFRRTCKTFHVYFIVLIIVALSQAVKIESDTQKQDKFEWKRQSARQHNPTYQSTSERGYGGDLYQPYYVCDKNNDTDSMTSSAWYYSCKQSCTEANRRQRINITHARWDYTGPSVNVYRVVTNEVCYTAHMNVWGYCSHTQTSTPVETLKDDAANFPKEYLTPWSAAVPGTKHIIQSSKAECEYWSDNTKCARDYTISYREGKTSQRSMEEPVLMNIYGDGIRADPYTGFLQLNDASWFWNPPSRHDVQTCGWKTMEDIQCSFTDTAEVLKCDGLGYSYNIQSLKEAETCIGKVYDTTGPVPFIYKTREYYEDRASMTTKATAGKVDADIPLVMRINNALTELESTYCSSSCDLFARQIMNDDDHVFDTPIGTWRLDISDPLNAKFIPCKATSSWKLQSPAALCHGKNQILVQDEATQHTTSWDTMKDYIVMDDLCSTLEGTDIGDKNTYKGKIARGENITIQFWTGDILEMSPPYTTPVWKNAAKMIRANPSWFSKVKLDKTMLHTKDDISALLTQAFTNIMSDISYKEKKSMSIRNYLFDEMGKGITSAAKSIWGVLTSIFGGMAKIVTCLVVTILLFMVIRLVLLALPLMSLLNWIRPNQHRVRFADELKQDYPGHPVNNIIKQDDRHMRRRPRSARKELASLII